METDESEPKANIPIVQQLILNKYEKKSGEKKEIKTRYQTHQISNDETKLKNIIKWEYIYIVEGYIRIVKNNIPQDIVDLILFMYTKPIIMNIKWHKQIKSIWYLPTEPEWKALETKISDAYDTQVLVRRLSFANGIVTPYNWVNCRWKKTHTFAVETSVVIDKIDKGLKRYYESLDAEYDALFTNYCDENGLDSDAVVEEF
eukprot:138109_1